MIVAIHQPHYLPYLGYFDKIDKADIFVFLDHVQFSRHNFQHRNRVKTPGGLSWLSVPASHGGRLERLIEKTIATDIPWIARHCKILEQGYGRSPFFNVLMDILSSVYLRGFSHLVDLNIALVKTLAEALGLPCRWMRSSRMNLPELSKNELLSEICRHLGADEYLSGDGAKAYLDDRPFDRNRVKVRWQNFEHPCYTQSWMHQGFIANLSVVDLLANMGPSSARVLRSTGSVLMGSTTLNQR